MIVHLVIRDDGHAAEAVFASASELDRDRVLRRLQATAHDSTVIYEADLIELDDLTLVDGLVREAVGWS
jgi:hypothetical protein